MRNMMIPTKSVMFSPRRRSPFILFARRTVKVEDTSEASSTCLFLFLFLFPLFLSAQTEPNLKFTEGLYFSHAALLASQPDLAWSDIEGEMIQLPEDYRLQVDGLRRKDGGSLGELYAVSLDGFAYRFVREDEKLGYHEFAGLRLKGRYRYYEYFTTERTANRMYAYNPLNGQPFRSAIVERDRRVKNQVILDLSTGRTRPFNLEGVEEIVGTDNDLLRAVRQLSPSDADFDDKLRRALRVYNERYPLIPGLPTPE